MAKRGGFRKNAHRPPLYGEGETMVQHTIRITKSHTSKLKEAHPNVSKAIRAILDDPKLSVEIDKFVERIRKGE